jgi:hypothetical protein
VRSTCPLLLLSILSEPYLAIAILMKALTLVQTKGSVSLCCVGFFIVSDG